MKWAYQLGRGIVVRDVNRDRPDTPTTRVKRASVFVIAFTILIVSGCGAVIVAVDEEIYSALVPAAAQLDADAGGIIPGGFGPLRAGGDGAIEVVVELDRVTFRLDGTDVATRTVTDRVVVQDKEGSGPFKAKKEVLILGVEALRLGELVIPDPVIWPGSFEGSPVIRLKPWDNREREPVSCDATEACLLLARATTTQGTYADANDPSTAQNPIESIQVGDSFIEFIRDDGEKVRIDSAPDSTSFACGLMESPVWDVPVGVGLSMNDPVLVHTLCPINPGASIQLNVMERGEIPLLAPGPPYSDGEWCTAGSQCLWFVPT